MEMCSLLWNIMTWCHRYHITLKARHIPGCLNVMADLLSRPSQVQLTEWLLHSQVFKQICQKWFTPHVDHAYPPMALLHRVIQKNHSMPLPDHSNSPRLVRDALVLGPSAALNRDPTAASSVNNTAQIVPQLCVSQQSVTSQPPRLVSWSGQLQEQGFSVEVAERIAAPQQSSTRTIYKSKWAYLKNGAEKIRWISPLHL